QLVTNDPGMATFQAASRGIINLPDRPAYIPTEPYYIHLVTTPSYDTLLFILNQENQKRILTFRNRLSNTQYFKIVEQWKAIAGKPKPEIASQLWKSLDIREVNREFYRKIKERYDNLVAILNQQTEHQNRITDNPCKQFAVRLIGRYIFCWFLKEKGIIPAPLLASETIRGCHGQFCQTYLTRLFFDTLNTEVQTRSPLPADDPLADLYSSIPYLNGGLFEEHPEDSPFHKLPLDDWLAGFIEVLESFDFTVDESSSQYQQVAIDPEMLGRIFENLLASQNPETEKISNQRNAYGAFYTPREIVEYMADTSLMAWLEHKLMPDPAVDPSGVEEPAISYAGTLFQVTEPAQQALLAEEPATWSPEENRTKLRDKLTKLFQPGCDTNPFDRKESLLIQQALRDIRILDPACGSGAFPMTMLMRLMELRELLGGSLNSAYDLKNEILNRNIFGVDIMPMAIEIARLRAWLSLILEVRFNPSDRKHNFGIQALPNLDFKFVCANSLIDSGYDRFIQTFIRDQQVKAAIRLHHELEELNGIRERYFDPQGDQYRKTELRKAFYAKKEFIKQAFASMRKTLNLDSFLDHVDNWNPFDESHPSPFFSPGWMFGLSDGADIILGNPPYVQIQKMEEPRKTELESQRFSTWDKTGDLYQLFFERGFQLLNKHGILAFITSNKWMRTKYGASTRSFFSRQTAPIAVIDFGMTLVFESAAILTGIFIARKNGFQRRIPICRIGEDLADPTNLSRYIGDNTLMINNPGEQSWIAYSKEQYSLIRKIEEQGIPLEEWEIKINRGILTGYNEAFIIDQETRDRLIASDPKSAEIIKPILRGENIKPYIPEFENIYLINSHNGIKEEIILPVQVETDFPSIFIWLGNFKDILVKRQDKGSHWTNLRNCAYLSDFSKPKIIYPNMTKYLPFTYDDKKGYFCNDKAFIITGSHLKYLTGILNSSLFKFTFKDRFPELLGDTREVRKVFVEKIPIKKPTEAIESEVSGLVDLIMDVKRHGEDSNEIERQLDLLIYHYYQLTEEEIQLIGRSAASPAVVHKSG
ncbi:MAG: Eco57I restriction-modification methylase domain-containing protein, partial [Bacteroidales bacterium]|nr:Eco57I restriction-modification methylase domain-containing protein [Bacteroidales bacterium]